MYIQVRLKDVGWTKLYVQTDAKDNTMFLLVDNNLDVSKPYLTLKMKDDSLAIKHQRGEVEDDNDELKEKLNGLYLRIIEAKKQGDDITEIDEEAIVKSIKPYDPSKIRIEPKVFSLRQIYDMINSGDLNISPDFQRNEVWDSFRKSRLIESILLRIPLPVFYFSEDEKGVLSVVDGLQRLSAIKQFMDNDLILKNLEYLDNCENKYYTTTGHCLEDKYIRWFNATQISANVISAESPYQVKFDIFRRLNTGGKPLNAQELRNCLMNSAAREVLRNMASLPSFLKATGNSIEDNRMLGQEMAMRFIYFYDLYFSPQGIKGYNGLIDDSLDELVNRLRGLSKEQLSKYKEKYDIAMTNASYLFGKYAFRKVSADTDHEARRSPINKALFVSLSVILSKYDPIIIQTKFKQDSFVHILGKSINNDNDFFSYLSYGTNGSRNIQYVFSKVEKIINENLLLNE